MSTPVCQAFIDFVLSTQEYASKDDRHATRTFLERFVPCIVYARDFTVCLDDVAAWLRVDKANLKRTLQRIATEGRDYKTSLTETSDRMRAGRPIMKQWLTNDCLKRLICSSQTPMAKQALSYFLQMEDMYREHLVNDIRDRLDDKEEEGEENREEGEGSPEGSVQKPVRGEFPVGHCIYVLEISCQTTGKQGVILKYKIGRTKDLNRRAQEHWATQKGYVRILYQKMCPNHKYLESCIHMALGKLKLDNEVFIADPEKIIKAVDLCFESQQQICEATGSCVQSDDEEESKCMVGELCGQLLRPSPRPAPATKRRGVPNRRSR